MPTGFASTFQPQDGGGFRQIVQDDGRGRVADGIGSTGADCGACHYRKTIQFSRCGVDQQVQPLVVRTVVQTQQKKTFVAWSMGFVTLPMEPNGHGGGVELMGHQQLIQDRHRGNAPGFVMWENGVDGGMDCHGGIDTHGRERGLRVVGGWGGEALQCKRCSSFLH